MASDYFSYVTKNNNFFQGMDPVDLVKEYGSPLYVYNEKIFRERCKEMKNLIKYKNFIANYSAKANSNLTLLKIVKEEGLNVDAMSPGEIFIQLKAGFSPEQIFYVCNNVSEEEMQYAINAGVTISVDSLSQLEMFGRINYGGKVAIRFNPGIGAGHSEKVVTAGSKTKFGIEPKYILDIKNILDRYKLKLIGINQHIGSLFMNGTAYIESVKSLLNIALSFDDLEFIDMGGGFGIPYKKQNNEERLDVLKLGMELDYIINSFINSYGKEIMFKIEPGRYIPAESGILLGTVNALKTNYEKKYIGTDIGFNVLARPVMYNSHHDIEIYRKVSEPAISDKKEHVTIVGNICESGDIIAKERLLPEIIEGDVLGILDAGAYGYSMSSNYNNRLRPAEILIRQDSSVQIIRRRDNLEDLLRNF